MSQAFWIVIACGALALAYGWYAYTQVMTAGTGTDRMREIAAAIQEGAEAYLNRQYKTIAMAGAVVTVILTLTLGLHVAIGFILGAVLSGAAGYIGMIGSRKKIHTVYNELKEKGIQAEQLQRVHAPIGLDIGAVTPEEIAVSIVAEMIQVRRGTKKENKGTGKC